MPDSGQAATVVGSLALGFAMGLVTGLWVVSMCVLVAIIIALSLHVYCFQLLQYATTHKEKQGNPPTLIQEANKLKT